MIKNKCWAGTKPPQLPPERRHKSKEYYPHTTHLTYNTLLSLPNFILLQPNPSHSPTLPPCILSKITSAELTTSMFLAEATDLSLLCSDFRVRYTEICLPVVSRPPSRRDPRVNILWLPLNNRAVTLPETPGPFRVQSPVVTNIEYYIKRYRIFQHTGMEQPPHSVVFVLTHKREVVLP